ncbi:MAG: SpoIID/LytB domain-containing protein [bacterium]|nr:SpoIID/LytB domain-containing protein [bacterium]
MTVDIGLLWDEETITGELLGGHAVQCRTDCCRYLNLAHTTGRFTARAATSPREGRFALRLGEMFSPPSAEQVLAPLSESRRNLDLDVLEAGKRWEFGGGAYDNRVWWPIVKCGSRADAESLAAELREQPHVDPLAITVVRLDDTEPSAQFEFTLGDFSARVLEVRAVPLARDTIFRLNDVPIGRGFHWQRKEALDYRGVLSLFSSAGGLTAVNRLPLETYLKSTVGSEMRSDLPAAFSQAQAICARSTVLATANRHHRADGFDLCNDDHCQCYQGIQREAGAVAEPVRATAGQILLFGERVVDARYAKACGGLSERYEAVWGGEGPAYFAVRPCGDFAASDLASEDGARLFLESAPPSWCNPALHPYPDPWDKEPLFRWQFRFAPEKLGTLIEEKTGSAGGRVKELRPLRRGASGRILVLDVVGSERTLRVYGELNIRRALSPSHLPSSFFVSDLRADEILLTGGGWGHGVGLCQLGACAMAKAGTSTETILARYYPESAVVTA